MILYVYDYKTFSDEFILQKRFIDTNGVIRRRKVKKTDNTNYNGQKTKGQKDKQWCTKHYARNKRSSNTKPTENNECSGRLSRSYSTCDTRRVFLIVSYKSLFLCIYYRTESKIQVWLCIANVSNISAITWQIYCKWRKSEHPGKYQSPFSNHRHNILLNFGDKN